MSLSYLHRKDLLDDGRHVKILVFSQAATEDHILLLNGQSTILLRQGIITRIIHRVIGFHAGFVLRAVFLAHDRFGTVIHRLAEHLEMLMLYHTRIGLFVGCVIDNCVSLVVRCIFQPRFERHRPPIEATKFVVKVFINRASIDNFISKRKSSLLK